MIDKSSLLKSQGSLYLEFIPKDGLFHKMLLLSLMGFLTGWCNLVHKQHMRPSHVVINVLRKPILSGPIESGIGTVRDMSEIAAENKVY